MTGEHDSFCVRRYPACLCITCQHDHDYDDTRNTCCDEHAAVVNVGDNNCCPVTDCPDYLKEEEISDANT